MAFGEVVDALDQSAGTISHAAIVRIDAQQARRGHPTQGAYMDSKSGHFYGARCESIRAPIPYDRVIADSSDMSDLQFNFLAGLKTRRFAEIQKMTGAYQGARPPNRNQLVDAFQLWCAEFDTCTQFLTLDFKLVALMNRRV